MIVHSFVSLLESNIILAYLSENMLYDVCVSLFESKQNDAIGGRSWEMFCSRWRYVEKHEDVI